MIGIDENEYDGISDAESSAGGVIGLVANLADAEAAAKAAKAEYERLAVLQEELHEPENWCPEKAGELLPLLERTAQRLTLALEEHPQRMDGSGRTLRSPVGAHIEYDLELTKRQKGWLETALRHGQEHPETKRARQAVQAHVNHWISQRGR